MRRAFHLLYREGYTVPEALKHIEAEVAQVPEVIELVAFIRASTRGIILKFDRDAA